jgi:hypothetical protein
MYSYCYPTREDSVLVNERTFYQMLLCFNGVAFTV